MKSEQKQAHTDIQGNEPLIFVGLDFDGCLSSFFLADQNALYTYDKISTEAAASAQIAFKQATKNAKGIYVSTLRQTAFDEYLRAGMPSHDSSASYLLFKKFANTVGRPLITTVLQDVYENKKPGSTFEETIDSFKELLSFMNNDPKKTRAFITKLTNPQHTKYHKINTVDDITPEKLDSLKLGIDTDKKDEALRLAKKLHTEYESSKNNVPCLASKIDIVYFQMQDAARRSGNQAFEFHFYDDSNDYHEDLHTFFSQYPNLMPSNCTLVTQYARCDRSAPYHLLVEEVNRTQGAGIILSLEASSEALRKASEAVHLHPAGNDRPRMKPVNGANEEDVEQGKLKLAKTLKEHHAAATLENGGIFDFKNLPEDFNHGVIMPKENPSENEIIPDAMAMLNEEKQIAWDKQHPYSAWLGRNTTAFKWAVGLSVPTLAIASTFTALGATVLASNPLMILGAVVAALALLAVVPTATFLAQSKCRLTHRPKMPDSLPGPSRKKIS